MNFFCDDCKMDFDEENMPPYKREWVWTKFCHLCKKCHLCGIVYKGSSSNIVAHLNNVHKIFEETQVPGPTSTPPSDLKSTTCLVSKLTSNRN